MKIRPLGAKLFHAYGQTDRHDEANSRFSKFCKKRLKLHDKFIIFTAMVTNIQIACNVTQYRLLSTY